MTAQLSLTLDTPPPRKRRAGAMESFHVQAHMPVEQAIAGERRAVRQDRRVREVFERYAKGRRLTPSQVHGLLCDETGLSAPLLTSIRRSLTNLTKRGLLVHYRAERRMGPHGAMESTWGVA